MFAQGAQNVRCARCGHITPVRPQPQHAAGQAQLVCSNAHCHTLLSYPRGASQVQCSVCSTVSSATAANQVGHLVCTGCQVTLMYAHGAQSVRCAVCNCITQVSQTTAPFSAPQSTQQAKPVQTVIVQHPDDEQGNQQIAVGVANG